MGRYQWLLFDADGTLFDYDKAEARALRQAFQAAGLAFKPDYLTAYRGINRDVWHALEQGLISPDVLKVRRFELLFQTTGCTYPAADFSNRYLQALAACSELVEDAREVLLKLASHSRIAILTNGLSAVQRDRLNRSEIKDYVSEIIISEEIGAAKPDRAYFELAFQKLAQPEKRATLMIGDNWVSDIQGAAAYGLPTCWFNPANRSRSGGLQPTYEIQALRELLPLAAGQSDN